MTAPLSQAQFSSTETEAPEHDIAALLAQWQADRVKRALGKS